MTAAFAVDWGRLRVEVAGDDDELLARIARHYRLDVGARDAGHRRVSVVVRVDPDAVAAACARWQGCGARREAFAGSYYGTLAEGDSTLGLVALDGHEGAHALLFEPPGSWTIVTSSAAMAEAVATRTIRELVREHHLQGDALMVHASAVTIGGGCVALAGPSGAGKTTLAVALARAGAGLVSTDRVVLWHAGTWQATGVPSTTRLGPAAAVAFGLDADGRRDAGGGKVVLAQAEAAASLGCAFSSSAPLTALCALLPADSDALVPAIEGDARVVAAALRAAVISPDDSYRSRWLAPSASSVHPPEPDVDAVLGAVLTTVPSWGLRWDPTKHGIDAAADALRGALGCLRS